MGVIAVWFMPRAFTAAKCDHYIIICHILDRFETRSLVRAITEWLGLAAPACTPPVSLAFFNNNTKWAFFGNNSFFTHNVFLMKIMR
jgi:hypothetical protein